jgi:hypothetical protein
LAYFSDVISLSGTATIEICTPHPERCTTTPDETPDAAPGRSAVAVLPPPAPELPVEAIDPAGPVDDDPTEPSDSVEPSDSADPNDPADLADDPELSPSEPPTSPSPTEPDATPMSIGASLDAHNNNNRSECGVKKTVALDIDGRGVFGIRADAPIPCSTLRPTGEPPGVLLGLAAT